MVVGKLREIWRYPVKSMGGETLDFCDVTSAGLLGDRGWALRDDEVGEIRGAKNWPLLMQCTSAYRESPSADHIPHARITLPDGTTLETDDPIVSERISKFLGESVSLWPILPANNTAHYRRAQVGATLLGLIGKSRTIRKMFQRIIPFTHLNAELRALFSREPGEPLPDLSDLPAELYEFTSPPGTYFDAYPIHIVSSASLKALSSHNPKAMWDVRRFRPNLVVETDPGLEGLVENEWCGRSLQIGSVTLRCEIPAPRCGMTMHAQPGLPKDPTILRTIVREANQNLGIYAKVVTAGRASVGDSAALTSSSG